MYYLCAEVGQERFWLNMQHQAMKMRFRVCMCIALCVIISIQLCIFIADLVCYTLGNVVKKIRCLQMADHTSRAVWLGPKLEIRLPPFVKMEQQIAVQVKDGEDEATLLWPFV